VAAPRWLVLWRHGEAEPAAGVDDRARRLTRRGLQQARAAAHRIASLQPPPTLMIYSSAPRAAETAACAAEALALPDSAQFPLDELYLASPEVLRAALARHAGRAHCILVVGHNPGLGELGARLDPARAGAALDTAGWWRIALDDSIPRSPDP
jgi:phosphohistidine phosphatase